jgi:hypothetical protein
MKRSLLKILLFITVILAVAAGPLSAQQIADLEHIASAYKVPVLYGRFTASSYACRYAKWDYLTDKDTTELKAFAVVFREEWSKYPVSWIRATGIRRIIIVKNLIVTEQKRAAMPDYGENALYLDISFNGPGGFYMRHVIHHEFFHLVDYFLNRSKYGHDPEWEKLNPKGFRYGKGGETAYTDKATAEFAAKRHPTDGFVNGYSTLSIMEDKAEIYASLMQDKKYRQLMQWAKEDRILAAKVKLLIRFLHSRCPDMGENYFHSLHKS